MVWDSICGGRAIGMAAVMLVMAGEAGELSNGTGGIVKFLNNQNNS
jgi:hypothetical protein